MIIYDHHMAVTVEPTMFTNELPHISKKNVLLLLSSRILHQGGYTKEEQLAFRSIIYGNILQSALAIIRGMEMLDINYGSPASQVCKATWTY